MNEQEPGWGSILKHLLWLVLVVGAVAAAVAVFVSYACAELIYCR